jgi:UDP-N-acetylmuramoyl-tripeptide--D-alanyl-D-alanine ligase
MPFHATLAQVVSLLNPASVFNLPDPEQTVTGLTTDSRAVQPGEIFLALRGEKFDGHQFVASAIAQGALAAIVETDHGLTGPLPLITVTNSLRAYQDLAHWWRQQFTIPVIAITGSVGKTTAKELVAAMLSHYGPVLKSQANFNNEIGVPKTLLELGPEHQFAVIEMGMRGRGQIAELAQIAAPTIGLITTVGTAHIELLGSRAAIAEAKCELFAALGPDGIAVQNQDNDLLVRTTARVWQGRTIGFGLSGGELQGQWMAPDTLEVEGQRFPQPLPGEHNALNYLAALAVLRVLDLSWQPFTQGLVVDLPGGRAKRYTLPNDIVLLDETYNAGLESMLAALRLLAQTPGQRRIGVLGTMKELGDFSLDFHRQVGQAARQLGLDRLLILADPAEAKALAAGAEPLPAEILENHAAVSQRLQEMMQPGDRILFKASRAVGLDRVVADLKGVPQ